MSIKEITGKRISKFSKWIRPKSADGGGGMLHSCFGYLATDQDWIIYNYNTKRLILLEEKSNSKMIESWQKQIFKIIDAALKEYCPKNNIKYYGYHLLRFEKEGPQDGKIFWHENCCECKNAVEITEKELKNKLSLK